MSETGIRAGTACAVRVGRNQVKVRVVSAAPGGGWVVRTESGREMKVKNVVPIEQPAPEAAPAKGAGRLSLLNAAAEVLAASEEAMTVRAMLEAAKARGLWTPGAGKTPEQTLYSAILREMKTRGAASRFVKSARGLFRARTT